MIAFSASDDFTYFRNNRVYIRPTAGGQWKKLGADFDGDVSAGFWSDEGKTIYFSEGWRATSQLFSVSTETGKVMQLTKEKAVISAAQTKTRRDSFISYSDSMTPANWFTTPQNQIGNRASWKQISDSNPQSGASRWARPKRSNGNRRTEKWWAACSAGLAGPG